MAFGTCVAAAVVLVLYQFRIRKRSNDLIATLHVLKRELKARAQAMRSANSSFEVNVRERRQKEAKALKAIAEAGDV